MAGRYPRGGLRGAGRATIPPMAGFLKRLFGGGKQGVTVPGGATIEEGTARGVDIGDPLAGGTRVVLAKVDGEVFAVDSRCPHAGGQIQTGPLEKDRFVVCPLHRYLFDPRTGHAEGVACAPVKRYRVVTRGDDVEVFV